MNAISKLPIGYMTGYFALAEEVLNAAPNVDCLLNVLLLSDQLHEEQSSHRTAPEVDWDGFRQDAGARVMQLLNPNADPKALAEWRDRDADWHSRTFRHASKAIPTMPDGELLTLFVQASETAYLDEGGPMQVRWEKVASQARAEILARIGKAGTLQTSSPPDTDDDDDDFYFEPAETDAFSWREMLRVAETSLDEGMSDERLLDLHLLVEACGPPDNEVFHDVHEAVSELLYARMYSGAPDIDPHQHVPGFDPHEHERALEHVMNGQLSHEDLTMAYGISFNNIRPKPGDRWVAVNDLCRAQILRRMAGIDRPRGNRNACMRRLLGNADTVSERGGGHETQA